jgi:two-component system, LytTR family, sensor kinase
MLAPVHLKHTKSSIHLQDVVNVSALQRIQDTFAKALGVAAVTVDLNGKPVTRESEFQKVCRMIRSTEAGLKRCMRCDADGGMFARESGVPHVYVCKGGFIDIAAPIIIQGEYMGAMLCGQVVPASNPDDAIEGIVSVNAKLGLPIEQLRQAAKEIPMLPRHRVDAAGEMLFQMANYIVEIGVANLTKSKLLDEMRQRTALQSALQDAQLQMLESQIAPHFLFNALGLLGYTALEENAPQTEEIAYSLSDLLRYSLRGSNSTPVKLRQELEIIDRYLSIQKLRFRSRLNVDIQIDPSLLDKPIPCMVLQPLIENAVIHAVEPLSRPVNVQIAAANKGKYMLIEIMDDGAGMAPDVLDSVRSCALHKDDSSASLGLRNVVRRLQLQFGDRFTIHIMSEPGHGTQIALLLPVE